MNGLPLIAHTIKTALEVKHLFHRIIVSTEDEEIAEISKKHGAEVPFLRPMEMATDKSPSIDLVKHAVLQIEEMDDTKIDAVMLLQPTNPLRVKEDIIKIKNTPFVHPVTKEKMTLFRGLQLATDKDAPLHMQHEKLVKNSPLKNLSPSIGKTNLGLGQLKNFTAEDLKKLGIRSVLPGGKKVYGPKLTVEQRIKDYGKWANRKLLEGDPSTIKTPKNIIKQSIASQMRTMDGETISAYKSAYPDCFNMQGGKNPIVCLTKKAENDPKKFARNSANIAKATEGTKTSTQMINFLKKYGKLGRGIGWFAAGEAAFAPLIGLPMWAQGASKDEILHTLTWGAAGTKPEDKLLGRMSDAGRAVYKAQNLEGEIMRAQEALENAPDTGYQKLQAQKRLNELQKEYEATISMLQNPDTGEFNQNLVDKGFEEVEEATTYFQNIKEQNVRDRAAWMTPKVSSVMEKVVDRPASAFTNLVLGPDWKKNLPQHPSSTKYPHSPATLGQHLSYDPNKPMFKSGGRVPYRNGSILGDARGWERMPDQRDPAMLEAQKQRLAEQVKKANERRFLHRSQYEDTGSFIPEYVQDVAKTTFGTSEGRKYLSSKFGEGVTEGIEWLGMQLPHLIGQTSPVGLIKMQKRMKEGNFSWADLLYQPKLGEKLGMNDYQQKQLEKLRDKALAGGKRGIPKGVETLGTTGELTGAFLDPFAAYGGYKFLKGKTPKIKKTGTEEPVDIGRRDTLKIIGTGGLVAALAKIWPGIFKGSKAKVASKVAKANYVKQFGNVKGMPDFIPSFILKATQSGKLKALPDKDYMSGMVYEVMLPVKRRYYPTTLGHKYPVDKTVKPEIRMEKVPVTVEHVPNTGEMVIHWKGIDNFGNEIDRSMYYKPGETGTQNYAADELGRGTSKEEVVIQDPEFEYTEPDYSSMGPDDTSPDSPSYLDAWDDADEIVEAMEEWVKGVDEKFKKKAAENMRLYNQTDEHFGTATGYQNTAGDWIPDDNNMPFPDTDKSTTDVFKPDWSRKKKASGGSVDYYDNYLPDPDDMDY